MTFQRYNLHLYEKKDLDSFLHTHIHRDLIW
jgi:hypothetical protein